MCWEVEIKDIADGTSFGPLLKYNAFDEESISFIH